MLLIKDIIERKEELIEALAKRNLDGERLLSEVLLKDEFRRKVIANYETLLAEGNKAAK